MKRLTVAFALLGAMVLALTATAGAQDGPTITADPSHVEASGDTEFVITGSGWTAAPPIFVLPCEYREDTSTLSAADGCDAGNLTPATPDADGNFRVTVTYTVPEEGMVISAGEATRTESDFLHITVGPMGDMDGMGDMGELPDTGVESGLLVVIGAAVVAGGLMLLVGARRFARI